MIAMHILTQKGSAAVETIPPDASVAQAAAILTEKGYGALVVSATGNDIAGIISERDIVHALARQAGGCLNLPVSQLMTKDVKTCELAENSNTLLERMTAGRFRHMPVVEDGKMVGLLSIGDVVKARITEIEQENAAMAGMLSG